MLVRLHQAIITVCPILGVSGAQGDIRIDFDLSATAQQQADAQAVVAAFDWSQSAHDAWLSARERAIADDGLDADRSAAYKILRALGAVLADEINLLRQWHMSFKGEVAAASNLADLKNRVATLPNLPDRTLAQAVTAIKAKISAGVVD